jgi:hypothetical protein
MRPVVMGLPGHVTAPEDSEPALLDILLERNG